MFWERGERGGGGGAGWGGGGLSTLHYRIFFIKKIKNQSHSGIIEGVNNFIQANEIIVHLASDIKSSTLIDLSWKGGLHKAMRHAIY